MGGPDLDPPVKRDVTYILERPTSRAYRVAYGTRWIHRNVPETDFIFYLDDDSFLSVPRLLVLLESIYRHTNRQQVIEARERAVAEGHVDPPVDAAGNKPEPIDPLAGLSLVEQMKRPPYVPQNDRMESLVLGYMMQTDTDMSQYDLCTMCGGGPSGGDLFPKPYSKCDRCYLDDGFRTFCSSLNTDFGADGLSLGGCMAYMNTCQIYGVGGEGLGDELAECIVRSQREAQNLVEYFGSAKTPLWVLGMGWLFGRKAYEVRNLF